MKLCPTALLLLFLYPHGPAAAQTDSNQALLTEVRQLRLTLERAMSLWPQSQLVLQRVGLQQQHVESISRQLEQVRDQVTRGGMEVSQNAVTVTRMESALNQEQNENRRRDIEVEIKRLKAQGEEFSMRNQQLQAREAQLAGQFQAEQARLTELNDRLDGLERMLQSAPAK